MKKKITLTESQLISLIKKTVNKIISEQTADDFLDNYYVSPELSKGYEIVNEINLPDGEYVSVKGGYAAEIFNKNNAPTGYLVITNKGTRSVGLKELVEISNKQLVDVDVYKILFKKP